LVLLFGHRQTSDAFPETTKGERIMRWAIVLFLTVSACLITNFKAEGAIYWHFTLQAQKDGAEEWLWVTLKEVPKKVYFGRIQQKVQSLGGKGLSGARLVQIRALAWRRDFHNEEGYRCDTYLPEFGKHIKYWQESWSHWVFCEGQVLLPGTPDSSEYFQLGLMRSSDVQRIINRQGRFLTIEELPGEELKDRFNIYPLEYQDPLTHYEDTCRRKKYAKHYRSLFMHFTANSLQDGYRDVGLGFATVRCFDDLIITYSLYRSRSPKHRFFGKRIANFDQVQDIFITEELAAEEALLGEEEEAAATDHEETMTFTEEEVAAESEEEVMVFTEEETGEEVMTFTEEEIETGSSEEVMTFTPEEIDLSREEGIEITQRSAETSEEVVVFTEEETR
jgi:hypothetical protein